MVEDDFFDDDFQMSEKLLEDIKRARLAAKKIAEEDDYAAWHNIKTENSKSQTFGCESAFIPVLDKIPFRLETNVGKECRNEIVQSRATLQSIAILATNEIELLLLINEHSEDSDSEFCLNVLEKLFATEGRQDLLLGYKKRVVGTVKAKDKHGVLCRILIDNAVSHQLISDSHMFPQLILMYCTQNIDNLNSNYIYILHLILKNEIFDNIVQCIFKQNLDVIWIHFAISLELKSIFVDQAIENHPLELTDCIKSKMNSKEFGDSFKMFVNNFGKRMIPQLAILKIPIFSWFTSKKYIYLSETLKNLRDLGYKYGGSELLLDLFEDDTSILYFVEIFKETEVGQDPLCFMGL
eukprot:NODE_50_length_31184_cov_0.705099.p10 type:complete len:352 gc:universal NODE_50_length_31184_cov_0.705099:3564-4619(+)